MEPTDEMEQLAREYLGLQETLGQTTQAKLDDERIHRHNLKLNDLRQQMAEVTQELTEVENHHDLKTKPTKARLAEIEQQFKAMFDGSTHKLELDGLQVEWKETKAVRILDQAKIITAMVATNKVHDGVGSVKALYPMMQRC